MEKMKQRHKQQILRRQESNWRRSWNRRMNVGEHTDDR